jgi:hypothetical protein
MKIGGPNTYALDNSWMQLLKQKILRNAVVENDFFIVSMWTCTSAICNFQNVTVLARSGVKGSICHFLGLLSTTYIVLFGPGTYCSTLQLVYGR